MTIRVSALRKGGENAGALVAEGLLISSGAGLETRRRRRRARMARASEALWPASETRAREWARSPAREREDDVGTSGGDEGKAQHPLHGRGIGANEHGMQVQFIPGGRGHGAQRSEPTRRETGNRRQEKSVYCTGAEDLGLALPSARGRAPKDGVGRWVRRPLQFSATTMLFRGGGVVGAGRTAELRPASEGFTNVRAGPVTSWSTP